MKQPLLVIVGIFAAFPLVGLAQNSNTAPNNSTACAIAVAPPVQRGTILINGPANIGCGGRSTAEIDSYLLQHCPGCAIVARFTHACGAYAASPGRNDNTIRPATGWATVSFGDNENSFNADKAARQQAIDKCTSNGGIRCDVGLSDCDTGNYMQHPGSGQTAH